ncbi:hypothetical protein TOTORO_01580 [Serratia phage vB_SmaS-Totoro]|nr:hypothetical protein TOTORO_01580 [Serratia phage vB_SmaS-Totoro]
MKPGNLGKTPVTGTNGYVTYRSVRRKVVLKRSHLALAVAMGVLGERK